MQESMAVLVNLTVSVDLAKQQGEETAGAAFW